MDWNWNDIRHFLAVARTGSTSAAARSIRLNQTTVARRVTALEQAIGAKLFERSGTGYALTEFGSQLISSAEMLENGAAAISAQFPRQAAAKTATIRISTNDVLAEHVVQPVITQFATVRPEVNIDLDIDNAAIDFATEAFDLALRAGQGVEVETHKSRQVMMDSWSVYCSRENARSNALPANLSEGLDRPVACLDGTMAKLIQAMRPGTKLAYVSDSILQLADVVAAGDYICPLPRLVGANRTDLHRCFDLDIETGSWLIWPERVDSSKLVKEFSVQLILRCSLLQAEMTQPP